MRELPVFKEIKKRMGGEKTGIWEFWAWIHLM